MKITTISTENELYDLPPMEPPKIHDKTLFQVGVSGGKDSSAALLWLVRESGIDHSKIQATFCDIGNDHEWTLEHIHLLSERVFPIHIIKPIRGFYDMCRWEKTLPNPVARFCTRLLKIEPTADYIRKLRWCWEPISVSGVRAEESTDRAKLPEWDYNGIMNCYQWRPLIKWSLDDVFAIHKRHNIPLNPLYSIGAQRVGCWPCIMSQKSEIRNISLKFPARIETLRAFENEMDKVIGRPYASFFQGGKIPKRFHTKDIISAKGKKMKTCSIDDVVRWSMTGKQAKGSYLDKPEKETGCQSGFCE